jgi:hypothetical protein
MLPVTVFTSKRERRLWAWTLVVVIAIYATLLLDFPVFGLLQRNNLVEAFYASGLLLVIATISSQGFQVRPGGWEVAITLGVVATYLLVFVRMAFPGERTHLIEYGIVAVFIYEALIERGNRGRPVPVPALLAILVTSTLGIIDELVQRLLPDRVFDLRDMFFNVLAATMAVATCALLARIRRR